MTVESRAQAVVPNEEIAVRPSVQCNCCGDLAQIGHIHLGIHHHHVLHIDVAGQKRFNDLFRLEIVLLF